MKIRTDKAFYKFCKSCKYLKTTPPINRLRGFVDVRGKETQDDTIYSLGCYHDEGNTVLAVMGVTRDPTICEQEFTPPTECPFRLEMFYLYGKEA